MLGEILLFSSGWKYRFHLNFLLLVTLSLILGNIAEFFGSVFYWCKMEQKRHAVIFEVASDLPHIRQWSENLQKKTVCAEDYAVEVKLYVGKSSYRLFHRSHPFGLEETIKCGVKIIAVYLS